ncbi:MAG: prolyl-tRNA synthetase associated domain-containing protein [Planctomycetota bacterium]
MSDLDDEHPVTSQNDPRVSELFLRLESRGIEFETIEHEALHSVEDAARARRQLDGVATKNLFLRDKRGRMFLLTAAAEREIDLLKLGPRVGARGRLSFASDERLARVLRVRPGSVSLLAATHARPDQVTLIVDDILRESNWILQHPLHNRATTRLRTTDLWKLLADHDHAVRFVEFGATV